MEVDISDKLIKAVMDKIGNEDPGLAVTLALSEFVGMSGKADEEKIRWFEEENKRFKAAHAAREAGSKPTLAHDSTKKENPQE